MHKGRLFLKKKKRKDNGKKGRKLVEHIGVGKHKVIYGVKVRYKADSSEKCAPEDEGDVLFFRQKRLFFFNHHNGDESKGNGVTEKSLLKGWKIVSRKAYKNRHCRKSHCGKYNTYNALGTVA